MPITTLTRQGIRDILNKMVGSTINVKDFSNKHRAASYLCQLIDTGHVKRISLGNYKVLKKITLKKRGRQKGKCNNWNLKDVSAIPSILNSSKDGLIISQIQEAYQRITPPEKQVNRSYLYRMFGFGIKKGIILENGYNEERKSYRGVPPKRRILANPYITTKEWDSFVSEFRLFYQHKKENQLKRRSKFKTIMDKFKDSDSIIQSFNEDRDNLNKQFVEDYFIDIVQKHLGKEHINCFAITGPDYFRHVTKLFNTIANKVIICELKPDVFDIIYRKAQVCPHYINNKVSLLNCDINDISPSNCQYIDLDLMGCIGSIYESIVDQIKNQIRNCDNDSLKFITFTASTRSDGGVDARLIKLMKLLYETFKLKMNGFQGGDGFGEGVELFNPSQTLNFCLKRIPQIKEYGRVKDIHIFTYLDHSPMLSALIIYK